MTPEEVWAEIVAARMTGEPMPYDEKLWEIAYRAHGYRKSTTRDESEICRDWQEHVALHARSGGMYASVVDYRRLMLEKYQPKETNT